jgi:photosystem II stability/assembly factor-like uncharacterized protein
MFARPNIWRATGDTVMRSKALYGYAMAGLLAMGLTAVAAAAQTPIPPPGFYPVASTDAGNFYSAMHWRMIGPTRGGRARAVSGVADQPNVAYIGFDNGGVWRSTDYGSNWQPLFDGQDTGSIGAIAVAPSDPNIIYVGTGAGIIRPDLATGDGMYKSTDAGKTWTHLGLRDSQMIAAIAVDPGNPDRLFVAALGHPYGPNAERGIFRSTDGGKTFQKVLYKDEYTSGNDVIIDPRNPNIVYAGLWQQQQGYSESTEFGGAGNGIFKSTDGGTTWKHLTNGLPSLIQANLAMAPDNSNLLYAMVAHATPAKPKSTTGEVDLFRSNDGGASWHLAINDPSVPAASRPKQTDSRPLERIGGGDLPTLAIDPQNANIIYVASRVFWRSEDGGATWTAVRGSPGGDDYQKLWINPKHPNVIVVVADQGGVVSSNRGDSWSNWYTQPTAAMYHASTDNSFPYKVCGGQQDSGSACVDSRSNDGMITFRDWRPVNIQEYGMASSDPKDPDLVFGSMRSNISLYNFKTGQTTYVGPDTKAKDPKTGEAFNRNVRTMPLEWSPVDHNILYYGSNAVWKSTDQAHTWTRISPDLSRKTWTTPPNVGKYASEVKNTRQGALTAISPSPLDVNVIWAGTEDGNIQVTMDGGKSWTNVTPPQIKAWSRVFNIDAGHFDKQTAYAAVNTMRLDDMNPHLWRTHDGGKTWTEIDNGIAPGAVTNTIREDPRTKGLLYAGTDAQVWVSFNDGDKWQSLKLDMPAISVRDLQVKDDDSCLCSDLVAATHGRGFYILDDVTPLRQNAQMEAARAAKEAYLYKPVTAVRVRFAMNDPTPWPPEVPHGDNPPPGGILDYFLPANVSGPVKLDILDGAGQVIRSYASTDPVRNPEPALNPVAYNKVCQDTPSAPDCGVPLYWAAPPTVISTQAGLHRMSWDLRYNPIIDERASDDENRAVPHRTYPKANAPWAAPGEYTVRLTVDGKTYTQPLDLRMDPRVQTPPAALAALATLTRQMYAATQSAHAEFLQARALLASLDKLQGKDVDALKAQVKALAPPPLTGMAAMIARYFGAPPGPPTLTGVTNSLNDAMMALQDADTAPTETQVAACNHAKEQLQVLLPKWETLKTTTLAAFNARRKEAGQPEVTLTAQQ